MDVSSCADFKKVVNKIGFNFKEQRKGKQAACPKPVASSGRGGKALRDGVGLRSPETDLNIAGDQGRRKVGLGISREVLPGGLGKDVPPSTSAAFSTGFG